MKTTPARLVASILTALVSGGIVATSLLTSTSPKEMNNSHQENISTISEAKNRLTENLSQAINQKEKEFAEIEANYKLPSNSTFENDSSYNEINEQLQQVTMHTKSQASANNKFKVEPVWYEPGYFKSDALVQWQCAWLREAVLAEESGNKKNLNDALAQLESFKNKPEISMFPDYDVFLADNVKPLIEGNTAPARKFINSGNSCVAENQIK